MKTAKPKAKTAATPTPTQTAMRSRAKHASAQRLADPIAAGDPSSPREATPALGDPIGDPIGGTAGTVSRRAAGAAAKRQAILDAALDEFSAKGFAAARMDDVAERAGVAKGTIYLYFKDKEALFQELVRTSLVPIVGGLKIPEGTEISVRAVMEAFADTMVHEVLETRRGDLIRLVISEGGRFPQLAEFHYHEVIQRGITAMRGLIGFGIARGEIKNPKLQEFPQLVIAPALVALLWQSMFAKFAPLDVRAMLQTHIDLLLSQARPS